MAFEDNLMTFIDHYKSTLEAKQNGEEGVHKEFATLKSQANKLKQDKKYAASAGEKSCNIKKNRYKDILPFDYTRFILKTTESSPDGSDYINANYIEGTKDEHAYIAAQGPLTSTVNDFWRLLWECGGSIIIMACNEYEMGKNKAKQHKCERYWADEGEEKTFGDITVSLIDSEISKRDFCLRQLKAKRGNEEKLFHQFHYTAWPDHGVPDTVTSILELVRKAREIQPNESKPFIVHCSAGCGRTGTIIALDYVAELLKSQKIPADFSIFNIVFSMRKQRPAIVQTKEQYEFVHNAVSELFKHELNNLGVDYGHNYENVQIGVPVTGDKPRKPPTLPNVQLKSKSSETPSPPKPSSRTTAPGGKTDPTVYANADDVKTRPNSSPAVVSVTPRERSGRDIKIMDEVQKSVAGQPKEEHPVISAKPKKLPGVGKSNQSDGRRISGGHTARDFDKNSQGSSQEGGKQPAPFSSGSGKLLTSLPTGSGKPSSYTPPGNVKPSVAPGKGVSPSIANRMENLKVSHLVHSSTNGGKVSPVIRDSTRPTFQPPKPPSNAKGSSPKGSSAPMTNNDAIKRGITNNVLPDPSGRATKKPPAAIKQPPSPGGMRNRPKLPANDSRWTNNVVYNRAAVECNSSSGSGSKTNEAYESVDASSRKKGTEYELVNAPSPPEKTFSKATASSSSTYEDVSFKPPPPRVCNLPSSRDHVDSSDPQSTRIAPSLIPPLGNSHHGALKPPNRNRSSVTSIKSNASTGSREDSPSRDSRTYEQDVVAPVVPVRTADSYRFYDDETSSDPSNQGEKSDRGFFTLHKFSKIRSKLSPATFTNDGSPSPPGNTAVIQPLGPTNHHSGVPVFPNRGPKPVGPRKLPQVGQGYQRTLPT